MTVIARCNQQSLPAYAASQHLCTLKPCFAWHTSHTRAYHSRDLFPYTAGLSQPDRATKSATSQGINHSWIHPMHPTLPSCPSSYLPMNCMIRYIQETHARHQPATQVKPISPNLVGYNCATAIRVSSCNVQQPWASWGCPRAPRPHKTGRPMEPTAFKAGAKHTLKQTQQGENKLKKNSTKNCVPQGNTGPTE